MTTVDLPKIPSLPPIEMPDALNFLSSAPSSPEERDTLSPLHHSSTSLVSQDTFMTANSTLSPDSNPLNSATASEFSAPSSQLVVPPIGLTAGLRKSLSIDSFSLQAKHRPSSLTIRPTRGNTTSFIIPQDSPKDGLSSGARRDDLTTSTSYAIKRGPDTPHIRPTPSRSRGASVSTNPEEHEVPQLSGSDIERSDELKKNSVKGKCLVRDPIPEGGLTLPPRIASGPSASPSTTGNAPVPIVPERSSSLTHQIAKQRSLMSLDTHLPHRSEISLAVVGASGCGKSTVVRKGLKGYGLSEPIHRTVPRSPDDPGDVFKYHFRAGKIPHEASIPDTELRVLEVDISSLNLSQPRPVRVCPEGAPSIDAIIICYDAGRESSFAHVEDVLRLFGHLNLPTIVLACKSDLEKRVDSAHAASILQVYSVGLIEVSAVSQQGKSKIRTAFDWIFRSIFSDRGTHGDRDSLQNPASPSILSTTYATPWDISRADSATPTASSATSMQASQSHFGRTLKPRSNRTSPPTSPDSPHSPPTPTSPARARSMSDLLSEAESARRDHREGADKDREHSPSSRSAVLTTNGSGTSPILPPPQVSEPLTGGEAVGSLEEVAESSRENVSREPRAPPWVTLDDLLDKLLFLAVSDDDPTFISHFLLTYRRFATPRNILLAMQKRMRSLDQQTGDPMFACFAQMKICCLLDNWTKTYPDDFAVPGTAGALNALIKSVVGKTYLLHYGSEFIPFTEILSTFRDKDTSWAMKVEDPPDDSDDALSIADFPVRVPESPASSYNSNSLSSINEVGSSHGILPSNPSRERKSSLPLSSRQLLANSFMSATSSGSASLTHKQILKKLNSIASELNTIDPQTIAQEITRYECGEFLIIKPRNWLQHVLGQTGKKNPETDPISRYNAISNHIAHWVLSLILCHERTRARARQIEKFAEVAVRLRALGNYSALRAVVAGVNGATFEGDAALEFFRQKSESLGKTFQSFDQLLQAVRSHQKYRLALRNTKGACIPALEIHLSDLIRAHEGNPDFHDEDPNKIHWAKFNMMGRFVDVIASCQQACRDTGTFTNYPARTHIKDLLLLDQPQYLMDEELQRTRTSLPDIENIDDPFRPGMPRTFSRDYPPHPKNNDALLKKIFFW